MPVDAIFLALLASAIMGFNPHVQNHALDRTDPFTGAFLSMTGMAAMFWVLAPFVIDIGWFGLPVALYFLAIGLVFPAFSQSCQILSVRYAGPALTSVFSAFYPLFAIVPAVIFLGESFGPRAAAGLALMIGATVWAATRRGRFRADWPLWAIAFPLLASMLRGFSQPAIKAGYGVLAEPFFATLCMATTSALVLAAITAGRAAKGATITVGRGGAWFLLSGVINGAGILCINLSVAFGDVSLVTPLMLVTPLFSIGFSAFVFRREAITRNHLYLALAVICGAALIVMR